MTALSVPDTLKAAVAHHQAGRLPAAETLYRQILERQPAHPDALHLLGLLAHHQGDNAQAVQLMSEALRVAPEHAPCHSNLGTALLALGRLPDAVASYQRALALDRKFPEAHLGLGNAYGQQGLAEEAIASYRRALQHRPQFAEAHYNLGRIYGLIGQAEDAARNYRRAIALQPAYADAHNNLGTLLRATGKLDEALASYNQAVNLRPDFPEAHNNLALALQAAGQTEAAILSLRKTLALKPDYAEAHNNLGAQFDALGETDEAVACYRRALALRPDFPEALNNLGNALLADGRPDEAVAAYDGAITARPDYAEAHNNRGNALQALGRLPDALASHAQALSLKPDFPDARWNQSFALLLAGDYVQGWRLFESRWELPGNARNSPGDLWLGDTPLEGKTLLVQHEQGFGDTLQMLRYVPALAAQGARVLLQVPASLVSLAASVPGVAAVTSTTETLPAFDACCPCMSLPLAFGTTLETIPAGIPYLSASPAARSRWAAELGPRTRPRIGLAWSGSPGHRNDRQRSVPLAALTPLLEAPADFISLQKEYRAGEPEQLVASGRVRDVAARLTDFDETAGLLAELDLLITVDTAVAHLAGALGIPTWLLLPAAPDYRWLLGRSDSPWYPTMRLFRQTQAGDWAGVLQRVSVALTDFLRA